MKESSVTLDISTGHLSGKEVLHSEKRIGNLEGIFLDEHARRKMDPERLVYQVQAYMPVKEGTPGGLYFGNSTIYPGMVGNEYFMTRGHFHAEIHTAEFYWCVTGQGALILMEPSGHVWIERMTPGSLHYIPGETAHRVANTGSLPLVFNACWPSQAGHDYRRIEENGFTARLLERDGEPTLVKQEP
jgi:glucose-6-phosphate isomerase